MHLVAKEEQIIESPYGDISFSAEKSIHTENSYKYTLASFDDLARRAGFQRDQHWTDAKGLFAELFYIRTP